MKEEITENGIVINSANGLAEIALVESDNCEECSAKIICKPKEDNTKILTAADPFGVAPGDEVKISVEGKAILKATILLYGVPLVLLLLGISFGMHIFGDVNNLSELYSFLLGGSLAAVYFIVMYIISKKKGTSNSLPKIVLVKKFN